MSDSVKTEVKIEIAAVDNESEDDDDTDYESHDEYQDLNPEVLEVHLNCSAESGETVIALEKDLEIVEEIYEHSNNSNPTYDNSKYFKKINANATLKDSRDGQTSVNTSYAKKPKIMDEVIVISDDDDANDDVVVVNETTREKVITEEEKESEDPLGSRDKLLLAKLQKIRRWKLTGLGNAILAGEKKHSRDDTKVRVLSYNILAQINLTGHQNLYRGKPEYLLEWGYRWAGIQREIRTFSPDIVTFQEVQFSGPDHLAQDIRPWFAQLGYDNVSQRRTGDKEDGCVIFFRKETFSLVSQRGVIYRHDDAPVLNKDNVGLVCCLKASTGTKLVVATTHLLFNPKRHEIRLAQTALLLSEVDKIAWDSNKRNYVPVIITGDLNTQPYSDTYNLLTKGCVKYAGLQCGRSVLPLQLLPPSLGVADTCQAVAELTDRGVTPCMGSGQFSHSLGLRSVYNHSRHMDSRVPVGGYEATTFHSTWVTVDYIFYSTILSSYSASKDGRQEGKLKLVGRLSLPTGPEISALGGLPSSICPSDHLPLLADFILKV